MCYVFDVDIQNPTKPKTVYVASDHGGFELKNYLTKELTAKGFNVEDLGFKTYDPEDDYPDLTLKLSLATHESTIPTIVICRNGVGVSILANRIKGVRCALSFNPDHAKSARRDDDANFLALPADYITKETALETALAFLETPFSNEERHIRRIGKIDE